MDPSVRWWVSLLVHWSHPNRRQRGDTLDPVQGLGDRDTLRLYWPQTRCPAHTRNPTINTSRLFLWEVTSHLSSVGRLLSSLLHTLLHLGPGQDGSPRRTDRERRIPRQGTGPSERGGKGHQETPVVRRRWVDQWFATLPFSGEARLDTTWRDPTTGVEGPDEGRWRLTPSS